jgi:hypothetical protein
MRDADGLDSLRVDHAFKLACGRLRETGADLCLQPTLSRLESARSLGTRSAWPTRSWINGWRLTNASLRLSFWTSTTTATSCRAHQQLLLFNAPYDERFLAVHYVFGLPGSKPFSRKLDDATDAVRTERVISDNPRLCRDVPQAKVEEPRATRRRPRWATALGLDIRFVVTNLEHGLPEWVYDSL